MKVIKITPMLILKGILAIGLMFLVIWLMANLPDLIRKLSGQF